MAFTRRTHIIRVPLDDPPLAAGVKPSEYIDLEVMDAVSFRIENGKEVILSMDAKKSAPWIEDDTGGGHQKQPSAPTQRTHMKRIVSGDQKLDVEVLDCWAARDQNGEIWVLDMQKATVFDITDGTGSGSTRRAHDEVITSPPGKKKSEAGESYLTSQRSDNIAFRKLRGEEVIISIPSCDDPNSQNVNFGRASTFMTPQGYDPNDESDSAVTPPTLADSGDQHNYVARVKGSAGVLTKDEKIQMGPFWWIRKVKTGSAYILFHMVSKGAPPTIAVRAGDIPVPFLYDNATSSTTHDVTWYAWQPATPGVEAVLISGGIGLVTWGSATLADALAGRTVMGYGLTRYGGGRPGPTHDQLGNFYAASGVPSSQLLWDTFFATQADAQAYANFLNAGLLAFFEESNGRGACPLLAVAAFTQDFNRYTRDVAIKCSASATLFADVTLATDPNGGANGAFQAQIYSVDTTSKTPIPDPITDLNKPPFLFNSEGVGSGASTTYTITVSRDTDPTDTVDPTTALRLFADVAPAPAPAP